MVHSYSSLSMYEKCPKQYHAVRIAKRFPYVQSPEALFGEQAHTAIEKAVINNHPVVAPFDIYQWAVDDYVGALKQSYKVIMVEHEFNFDIHGVECGAKDWTNKFWIGKADIVASNYDDAVLIDWKTGNSKYPDTDQLALMAMFGFMQWPHLQTIKGALVFLKDGQAAFAEYNRANLPALQNKFNLIVSKIDDSITSNKWDAIKSPLCPWCPVTDCSNWSEKRK